MTWNSFRARFANVSKPKPNPKARKKARRTKKGKTEA